MIYFAYGSNLCTARLEERVGPVEVLGTAVLKQHILRFDKESRDGSRKANALHTGSENDIVIGVLFKIDVGRKRDLDRAEGLGKGYALKEVDVLCGDNIVRAYTYYATDPKSTNENLPYEWYLELILSGAKEHNLPPEYIERLQAHPTKEDNDAKRAQKNRCGK